MKLATFFEKLILYVVDVDVVEDFLTIVSLSVLNLVELKRNKSP